MILAFEEKNSEASLNWTFFWTLAYRDAHNNTQSTFTLNLKLKVSWQVPSKCRYTYARSSHAPSPHIIWSVSCGNGMNFECHLPGIIQDLFSFFLHIGKSKNHPFFEIPANIHCPFCPHLADFFACIPPPLKKACFSIFQYVKNNP